jgi:glycosyltransferase involved in cell wall biosynthesis
MGPLASDNPDDGHLLEEATARAGAVTSRILFITARADIGGGPLHLDLVLDHLPAEFERWVACPDDAPYAERWRRHPSVRGTVRIPRRGFSPGALRRLVRLCSRERIDIVHSHGKGAGLYSRLLKLLRPSLRVVHTFHGVHIGQYPAPVRMLYLFVERWLSRRTDAFINVSNGERAECLRLRISMAAKSEVIPNGIPPLARSANNAYTHLEADGRPLILTLARFEYQKNMGLALDVAGLAQDQHPEWRFVWAGDGPELQDVLRNAKARRTHNVEFLGFTERRTDLLEIADVYLSTSRWEGLPYALIEACSMGVPIVATQVVGNDEVVHDGRNGFLFPPDDPARAVAQIHRILTEPDLRTHLAAGALAAYQKSFAIGASIARLGDVYRRL